MIELMFHDPVGSATGVLLPTGKARDAVNCPDKGNIELSVVDAGNLYVFVKMADVGLLGNELPKEIEGRKDVMEARQRHYGDGV